MIEALLAACLLSFSQPLAVFIAPPQTSGTRASDGRSYVSGYFALDLNGVKCGLVQKFSGGDTGSTVSRLPLASNLSKVPAQVAYNDFKLEMALSMAQPVKDWIDAALSMDYMRKSGELKAADFKRSVREIREFKDALITEIGFPACDAGAKDPAFMTLKFSPWIVRNKKGDGSTVDNPVDSAQKQWHPTDFKFTIDGLQKACAKITKVEAINIKISRSRTSGSNRDSLSEPGKIDYPNIKITVPAEYAQDFRTWFESFVVNGQNNAKQHKTGTLSYLNRTRQKELLTLTLSGLGIYKISAAPRQNNQDKVSSVMVEMYCESIRSKFASMPTMERTASTDRR